MTQVNPVTSISEQGEQAINDGWFAENGTEESTAVGAREVSDNRVAATRLFNQDLARRQIPDPVVHFDHGVGGSSHDDGVGVSRPIDPVIWVRAAEGLEEVPLVDVAREVEPGAQHERHAFRARARRRVGETDPIAVPVPRNIRRCGPAAKRARAPTPRSARSKVPYTFLWTAMCRSGFGSRAGGT